MFQTQQLRPLQAAVQPTQIDIGSLLTAIMPIISIMLMMGLLMPMMKQMGKAFD